MKRLTFSPAMAEAIRDGRKTETRRLRANVAVHEYVRLTTHWYVDVVDDHVRPSNLWGDAAIVPVDAAFWSHFMAKPKPSAAGKLRQARFVPLDLEHLFPRAIVLSVHRERLGDIDDAGGAREGCGDRAGFVRVWEQIHGEWTPDLEVDVVRFEVRS